LKVNPVSTMDMKTHSLNFFQGYVARNSSNFSGIVDQVSAEVPLIV